MVKWIVLTGLMSLAVWRLARWIRQHGAQDQHQMNTPKPVTRTTGPFKPQAPSVDTLWRVLTLQKLETLLSGCLWFSRLDKFPDPLEGTLPAANSLGLLLMLPTDAVAWIRREYRRSVLRNYAVCWRASTEDPPNRLWNNFGRADAALGGAVAIRTSLQLLRDALAPITGPDGPLHFGAVTYIDHSADLIPDGNVIDAAFVVQTRYEYQTEVRALIHTMGTAARDYLANKPGPMGPLVSLAMGQAAPGGGIELIGGQAAGEAIVVGIDPQMMITEIVIDPRSTPEYARRVLDLATKYNLADRVRPPVV